MASPLVILPPDNVDTGPTAVRPSRSVFLRVSSDSCQTPGPAFGSTVVSQLSGSKYLPDGRFRATPHKKPFGPSEKRTFVIEVPIQRSGHFEETEFVSSTMVLRLVVFLPRLLFGGPKLNLIVLGWWGRRRYVVLIGRG